VKQLRRWKAAHVGRKHSLETPRRKVVFLFYRWPVTLVANA
jgi:hypothetical protein